MNVQPLLEKIGMQVSRHLQHHVSLYGLWFDARTTDAWRRAFIEKVCPGPSMNRTFDQVEHYAEMKMKALANGDANSDVFFLVWREDNKSPKVKHFTEKEARAEAERLSQMYPGDKFFVLKVVSVTRTATATTSL
jgi:hypothetical protein